MAGEPVRPAIIWADTRSRLQADQLIERVGMERGYAITGDPSFLEPYRSGRDQEQRSTRRLRELLGGSFRHLARTADGYRVTTVLGGAERMFEHDDPATAYAQALLALIGASID